MQIVQMTVQSDKTSLPSFLGVGALPRPRYLHSRGVGVGGGEGGLPWVGERYPGVSSLPDVKMPNPALCPGAGKYKQIHR